MRQRTLCRGYTVKVQSKGARKVLHVFSHFYNLSLVASLED